MVSMAMKTPANVKSVIQTAIPAAAQKKTTVCPVRREKCWKAHSASLTTTLVPSRHFSAVRLMQIFH